MGNEGFFIDENDNRIGTEPGEGEPFPILCGSWPNEHAGALHRNCSCCAEEIGVSPKGIAFHDAYPEGRPLLCRGCFTFVQMALRAEAE